MQLLCLIVSHYGLGLTSQRADTVSGAGVGMILGTILRFWGTRTLVFRSAAGSGGPSGSWNATSGGRVGSWTG